MEIFLGVWCKLWLVALGYLLAVAMQIRKDLKKCAKDAKDLRERASKLAPFLCSIERVDKYDLVITDTSSGGIRITPK